VRWAFAAVLSLCTLVALWATAMSVREKKLAARRGERIQDTTPIRVEVDDVRPQKLQLRPGQKLAVEHFSLLYRNETLSVTGSQNRSFVEFINLKKGEQRGWQELRLTILEVEPSGLVVDAGIRPGAPSTGDGWYTAIRAGLQVEFDGGQVVTITSWDPAKPELQLKVQQDDEAEEQTLGAHRRVQSFGIGVELQKHPTAGWALLLKSH